MHAIKPRQRDTLIPANPGFEVLICKRPCGRIPAQLLHYPVIAWREINEGCLVPVMPDGVDQDDWATLVSNGHAIVGLRRPDGSVQNLNRPKLVFANLWHWRRTHRVWRTLQKPIPAKVPQKLFTAH